MSKKEANASRSVHRVDLSLPCVQTDAYEILYTIPPSQHGRIMPNRKTPVENPRKYIHHTSRIRSPARLKHLIGPVLVNVVLDTSSSPNERMSPTIDPPLNLAVNPNSSHQTWKTSSTLPKRHKPKPVKDDGDHSRASSADRLIYESIASFESYNMFKAKNNNMWQNMHHPQLTSTKALHFRNSSKRSLTLNEAQLKVPFTASLENLSQESTISINEQLYDRIENITKSYFPAIQQIRHSCACPEVTNNGVNMQRYQNRGFMPTLTRTRIVR